MDVEMDQTEENIWPALEEFNEPTIAKEYWDSEDENELDWTDILPEVSNDDSDQSDREEKRQKMKGDKKGQDSPWYPFRNQLVSLIPVLHLVQY
jgi:hypothetical protein